MDPSVRDQHVERVRRDGFTVVENAIEPALIDGLDEALSRLERELDAKPAANGFEGRSTVRIYNLLHADDMVIPLDKPHRTIVCNSMWALTDFTEANGATRLVPGSHRKENPQYGGSYETIPSVMPKGSVLIWDGALWHGGGANATQQRRTGIAMNYCAGFIRQQENLQLGLAPELVKTFAPRLQELVGYGVYQGLIGHIDKHSPAQLLNGAGAFRSIWD